MQSTNTKKVHIKNNNYGSTLVEMVVSLTILSIMLSLSVFGLLAWQDWANFKRENEYAQVLFIAAQNQLTEFSVDGRLEEMQESLSGGLSRDELEQNQRLYRAAGLNLTDSLSYLTNVQGEEYSLETIYPESAGKQRPELYQSEIISLRAETGEYQRYLDDPEGLKNENPEAYWVFELLGSYVYDTSILNGSRGGDGSGNGAAICVEITPEDGQVLSVLYSDRNDSFIYLGISDDKNGNNEGQGIADIANRTESYRRDRMVGYYGVDTLYASTTNEMIQPSLSGVKLFNKDTFYMSFKLSAKYRSTLTSQLTYVLDLNGSANVNDKKLTVVLDGSKLKNSMNAEAIYCPVSRYDSDGNKIEIGEFPILAWVEPDYTVHVVLDAADIQATTDLYEKELDDIHSVDKASDTKFSKTYSFFRFGVEADNVYASVTATGVGYSASKTVSNFGNKHIWQNQEPKHTVFAGENEVDREDVTDFTYSVTNARHLYNIRYIEDIAYDKEEKVNGYDKKIGKVTFILKADVDWKAFEQEGNLYNSYDTSGNIRLSSLNNLIADENGDLISNVNTLNCDFPSISQIRERDIIDGNNMKITGISVSEISNALYGIYISPTTGELENNRPTGFVNINYGQIKNLTLDNIRASGNSFVGGFCGINAGQVENLMTLNTDKHSLISGRRHIGGIIGFQIPTKENLEISSLVNRAGVEGVEAVGGIIGMVRNEFTLSDIDFDEMKGLSAEAKKLINNPQNLNIRIFDCKNYGTVLGVNSSELNGIYKPKTDIRSGNNVRANNSTTDDETEPRYIGGIAGYCYNQYVDDITRITIEDCTGAPQYSGGELLNILSDDEELARRLKGVYVGGIVGYNYFGQINKSSTRSEFGSQGCLFGYRYVGGIVGFNIGPASGIIGSDTSVQGENNNHVIAYEYAGGITGCNANVMDVDSDNNNIKGDNKKDPESLEGLLLPNAERDLNVKIDNWVNRGIVIAVNAYSGGITGYNAGYIYRCNSDVKSMTANIYFATLYSGNYAGGIAGYNNGIIGNSERSIDKDGKNSKVVAVGDKFSTVCYVKGHNYVGGIVGYNDVDSIVEDYGIAGGYVLGDEGSCFVGGYAGLNASVDLLMNMSDNQRNARFIYSNPNTVKGSYFVGGNIGGNLINMADNASVDKINGVFMTDNFLGVLEGKAFVGGFIGYNLIINNPEGTLLKGYDSDENRGAIFIIQRELIGAFEKSDASAASDEIALKDKKRILDNISEELDLNIVSSDKGLYISGQGADSTKVSFGTISGQIYIAGVMGYNDANTHLIIKNVENATPIESMAAVEYAEEQAYIVDGKKIYRTTDYAGNDKQYTYSYSGGIIGKVSQNTILDNCWNASSGTVTTVGTYTGGLCEINEGTIINCSVSNFGTSVDDYLGGLCGLNKNTIKNCSFANKAVSGRNVVGAIAAENFGTISDITVRDARLIVEGRSADSGEKDGVSGIYAGYNGITGNIILDEDIVDVSVTSGGRYVGIVAGINEGRITNAKNNINGVTDNNIILSGTVRGNKTVGGLVGMNKNQTSQVIKGYTNLASVTAINGNAGGIIGENASYNVIRDCVNLAVVSAPDSGNAGGITSYNNGEIVNCYNHKVVSASYGMCGGIVAVNEIDGVINACYVEPKNSNESLIFTSTKSVGAIAAKNAGLITANHLKNVSVTNETSVSGTSIGVVTGDNLSTGRIILEDSSRDLDKIENCQAIVQSNYCNVGGIAGTNAGVIRGTLDADTKVIVSVVNCNIKMEGATIASIGGVAGSNTGKISDVSVDAVIQGELGSTDTGYGGIAGYSGYSNETDLEAALAQSNDVKYPATITNCTFDGIINATGSSGAPVRVGGIVGVNGYGSKVEKCHIGTRSTDNSGNQTAESGVTYVTAGDYINKTAESPLKTDTKSYAFLGGIAGDNYGCVLACDNEQQSSDQVHIIGFAGLTGGIVGYNYAYGIVSGYLDDDGITEHYMTTGRNWVIEQRCSGNDRGPGGLIGKSDSAEDISYVINYAPVTCEYQSNCYAAGLIGVLEQQYALKTKLYKCENYGEITSYRSAGGLIGMLKGNGADFSDCTNWGRVYANTLNAGGFVALHHTFVAGMDFRHCANHGNIIMDNNNGNGVGGFIGNEEHGLNSTSYLYDCVNTGIIQLGTSTSANNKAGNFIGASGGMVYLELCRNYNTFTGSANGFVGRNNNAVFKNCFDNSNNETTNKDKTPFGGTIGNNTNMFYMDADSETKVSNEDYGVYFRFHEGPNGDFRLNGFSYRDSLKDPSYLFATPDVSTKLELYSNNGGYAYKQLNLGLSYDDDSQGIDSMVVHLWNGSSNITSAPNNTYSVEAIYVYGDGTTMTTEKKTATGTYGIEQSSTIVLTNPSPDKKPVQVKLRFDRSASVLYLHGIGYIPAAESGTGKEARCQYSGKKYDTTFSIEDINRLSADGVVVGKSEFTIPKLPSETWYCYKNDVMDINWSEYTHYRAQPNTKESADFFFKVDNGDDSPGMESFVFYLANDNTNPNASITNIRTYYYDYSVTFTDINGISATTDVSVGIGYDSGEPDYMEKSRQEVYVPDELDPHITSIVLHIKGAKYTYVDNRGNLKENPNTTWIYLRGFAWVPEGETTEQKMAAGAHYTAKDSFYDRANDGRNYFINLKVDYSGDKPYVYIPYNYDLGFYMTYSGNDPIDDSYYDDLSAYNYSVTSGKNSGSRIDTYLDIDPKFVGLTEEVCTVYRKLDMPANLKMSESKASINFSWSRVKDAYGYELYYEIKGTDDAPVYTSDVTTVGSLQLSYNVKIDNSWAQEGKRIVFYVRAINAYNTAHNDIDAPDYDINFGKYDSDWASIEGATIKKALPKPKVHIEIVAGNRSTFVLDNYQEYVDEGCTDCTISLQYNNKDYSWNVAESGKYRVPEYVPAAQTIINYYAKPNDSLKDEYTDSDIYRQFGEGHGNNNLPNSERYCTTDFYGFYGTDADNMEYRIVFTLSGLDTYLMTDISAYDKEIGATVVYDSEITHAANSHSNGGNLKLTSTLKNLPEEWFSDDKIDKITVRAYPYHSQYDMIHYGHNVAEGIELNGTAAENQAILAGIYDEAYFSAEAETPASNCIWDTEANDLKSGYLLIKQEDGTYNVFYSSVIELSQTAAKERRELNGEPYREYYKYDVYYRTYSDMSAETGDEVAVNSADFQESYWSRTASTHNNVRKDTNELWYVQEAHMAPVVDDNVVSAIDEGGHTQYTFSWDTYYQDTACWNVSNKRYNDSGNNRLTNAETGMYATWDAYCERINKAGIAGNASDSTKRDYLRKLMNAYYCSYSTASYRIDLIGTTMDGKEVILDTIIVDNPTFLGEINSVTDSEGNVRMLTTRDGVTATTYNVWNYQCTFTDVNNIWGNYPKLTARVMRRGDLTSLKSYSYNGGNSRSDKNGATYILPRYTDKEVNIKLKMNTISKPNVSLLRENGVFITDDVVYEVEWGSLTDENQKADLGGYLITVKLVNPADSNRITKTHYYYVTDVPNASDTIGLDFDELNNDGVLTDVTEYYSKVDDKSKTRINLSDYNADDVVEISVKAIARTDAENYDDSEDGVVTELAIPKRLRVPVAASLSVTPDYNDPSASGTIDMATYKAGYVLTYAVGDYADENTAEIIAAIALYDSKPEGADGDNSLVAGQWDEGAIKTLYTKDDTLSLGNASDGVNIRLDLTEFERYPGEYAGKWLKVALRATSNTKIDSKWSDCDAAGETENYVWIYIPNINLDDVDLKALESGDTAGSTGNVIRYYNNGVITNTPEGNSGEISVETQTLSFTEDKNVNGYRINIEGRPQGEGEVAPVYDVYLERHLTDGVFDGTWDVYLDTATDIGQIDGSPSCEQNADAVWIGNIGSPFASDGSSEESSIMDIPGIEAAYVISSVPYTMTAQLRYIKDVNTGTGSFLIVLPEITKLGESPYSVNDKYCLGKIKVEQYVKAGTAYTAGSSATFIRFLDEQSGKWSIKIER